MMSFKYFPRYAAFASLALALAGVDAMAITTGALYTTTYPGCSTVNGNIYADNLQVGLNGGPTNNQNNNLTDGLYYVQVTDPSGVQLGISQSQTVTVTGGLFANCYQLWQLVSQVTTPYGTPAWPGPQGFSPTGNPGGEYKVWISKDPFQLGDVSPTTNPDGWKTDNFKLNAYVCDPNDPNCGAPNPPPLSMYGYKCFDVNLDGTCAGSSTNPTIPNWQILLDGTVATFTDINGKYQFLSLGQSLYTVSETLPVNWIATGCSSTMPGATSCSSNTSASVNLDGSITAVNGPNFANVCLAAGGGLTLGFWSNQNGELILTGSKTGTTLNGTAVSALSQDLTTTLFTNKYWSGPGDTKYADFRSWLLNATATNMSYMLSAQLATMELNVAFNKVSGTAYVYAPNVVTLHPAIPNKLKMFVTINDLMAAAQQALDADKNAISGDPNRAYQQALEMALDSANNNLNFAGTSLSSCPYSF